LCFEKPFAFPAQLRGKPGMSQRWRKSAKTQR
jgi:hypothetical protein